MTVRKRNLVDALNAQQAEQADPAPGQHPAGRARKVRELRAVQGKVPGNGRTVAETAWEQVMAAHDSAQDQPGTWQAYTLRLPAVVTARLSTRRVTDRERTRIWSLAACHYLTAALTRIPASPDAAAKLGAAWRQAHRQDRVLAAGSGTRLPSALAEQMHALAGRLRTQPPGTVRAWEVAAAAVDALLDDLDNPAGLSRP